jgi:hypothetical protein
MNRQQRQFIAGELVKLAKGLTASSSFETLEEAEAFTAEIARQLRKHKLSLGIKNFRQNYKGTGSQKAARQIFISFKNGSVIDVWIYPTYVQYGGVVLLDKPINPRKRKINIDDAKKVADMMADDLALWLEES